MNEWVSVKDKLPEPYKEVLTFRKLLSCGGGVMLIDHLFLTSCDGFIWCHDLETWKSAVTHWMPLPKPPKGD